MLGATLLVYLKVKISYETQVAQVEPSSAYDADAAGQSLTAELRKYKVNKFMKDTVAPAWCPNIFSASIIIQ